MNCLQINVILVSIIMFLVKAAKVNPESYLNLGLKLLPDCHILLKSVCLSSTETILELLPRYSTSLNVLLKNSDNNMG